MKNNIAYKRFVTIGEVLKDCPIDKFAGVVANKINSSGMEVTIKDTSNDGIVLRRKSEAFIPDSVIVSAITNTFEHFVTDDIQDRLLDEYCFEYNDACIDSDFVSNILTIEREGKLIRCILDLQ